MSQNDVRQFIQDQIKILNSPLVLDEELKTLCRAHKLSEAKIRSILFKCNLQIKRHNRSKYDEALIDNVVNEVVQAERQSGEARVSRLTQLEQYLRSDISIKEESSVERRTEIVNDLGKDVPEANVLVRDDDLDEKNKVAEFGDILGNGGDGDSGIRSEQEPCDTRSHSGSKNDHGETKLDKESEANAKGTDPAGQNLTEYDRLRQAYIQQNVELLYQAQKLEYLDKLCNSLSVCQGSLRDDSQTDMRTEMNRFSVLVEKLRYLREPC
ncbi:hypothetical protein PUMCH_001388 [Australozyma saopauloensis]|uniref:Uncharacterized protein n=1 Tax=Australozyma saopauloensis TaxID=291208 RepID=A0AAX4H6D3_9ASCO|nr:hypothetical protein PUMCH_001388 [[Candida] saopauloensis]